MAKQKEPLELNPIFSVSEYIEFLNIGLRKFGAAKISGEVSSVTISVNGHVYFTIRDKSGSALIDCIIWRNNYSLCGTKIEKGQELIINGYPDIYPSSGRLSFKANTIELKGEGVLKKAYDELKKKLTKEGLFRDEAKREVPNFPEKIGVITSRQGAVIHDFLNNLGKHRFKIKMIDARVEGQEAVKEILRAIKSFKNQDIEVLAIMRGGGSLESMMPFNNETLVRMIADFPVPVIVGIGHHKDIPLVALASDAMASTPTAVANLLNKSWEQAILLLERRERHILNSYEGIIINAFSILEESLRIVRGVKDLIFEKYRKIDTNTRIAFQNFAYSLQKTELNLRNSWSKSVILKFESFLLIINEQISNITKIIFFNNPKRQLKLGYSIVRFNDKIIKDVGSVKTGEDLEICLANGLIISEVKKINKIKQN
ncbi:MAG: exodeoxyribonuclease VII large subunit [Patescibacteria group bacterium]|nr:exodeoxyribonuclease VII large subunit [Patescibacteria group bacterium]